MGVLLSKASVPQRVRVIIYEGRNESPRTFWIPLVDNRIVFLQHPFPSVAQFPRLSYSVYDIYKERFVEIGTFMSMDATFGENPFLIVRRSELRDEECSGLGDRIYELNSLITTDPRDIQRGTPSPQFSLSGLLYISVIAAAAFLVRQCVFMLTWVWNVPKAFQQPMEPRVAVIQPQRTIFVEVTSSSESDGGENDPTVDFEQNLTSL
ncbi:hypothetical protein NP233_g10084 [Leucocoprinus birnbaumii]|uniref:Uncharacterized protein n=1 Tax=Leucocoprinus birnbaumii TaxID=56174 RepID=A0AAD5VKZ6_9AGAR|nr:hypothetical protein NP233_g10084 [Leucocoprinus birnbaumii]